MCSSIRGDGSQNNTKNDRNKLNYTFNALLSFFSKVYLYTGHCHSSFHPSLTFCHSYQMWIRRGRTPLTQEPRFWGPKKLWIFKYNFIAGPLEPANSSILAAHRLFKEVMGAKSGYLLYQKGFSLPTSKLKVTNQQWFLFGISFIYSAQMYMKQHQSILTGGTCFWLTLWAARKVTCSMHLFVTDCMPLHMFPMKWKRPTFWRWTKWLPSEEICQTKLTFWVWRNILKDGNQSKMSLVDLDLDVNKGQNSICG